MDDINLSLQKCHKNGVKVYPVFERQWFIEVKIGDRPPKRIPKPVQQKDINESVTLTYLHYANKL